MLQYLRVKAILLEKDMLIYDVIATGSAGKETRAKARTIRYRRNGTSVALEVAVRLPSILTESGLQRWKDVYSHNWKVNKALSVQFFVAI